MFQQYFQGISWAALPSAALVLFLVLFVIVFARVFVFMRKGDFDAVAALPLSDGTPNDSREVQP